MPDAISNAGDASSNVGRSGIAAGAAAHRAPDRTNRRLPGVPTDTMEPIHPMSPQRILVVYATSHGQTAKIAHRIADLLSVRGQIVTIMDADLVRSDIAPRAYDGVIIGGSVIKGRHQRSLYRFVKAHVAALSAMRSAFFSVSGSAAGRTDKEKADARRCLDDFLDETGWHPTHTATFGGAMAFTKYNPLLRWMMKRISAKSGGPTDTSRDHELTDWTQVERFAEWFIQAAQITPAVRRPVAPTTVEAALSPSV
jgi:menaquinone-dependent protoporphyrinogen oxidase